MKKTVSILMALVLASATLASCGNVKTNTETDTYTAETVPAAVNEMPTVKPGGKIVVNFEGTVASVGEGSVILENGKVVVITDDTVITDANGDAEKAAIVEGVFIQGFTENDPEAAEITAKRIHIVVF